MTSRPSAEFRGIIGFLAGAASSPYFLALLAFDLLLITVHVVVTELPNDFANTRLSRWGRIDQDRTLPEFYEAAKMMVAALIVFQHSRKNGQAAFILPGLLILYLAADNILRFHENFGMLAGRHRHVGELAFMALFALMLFAGAAFSISRAPQENKPIMAGIYLAILSLGIFAAGVDGAHAAIDQIDQSWSNAFKLIEESGELIVQSLILACCIQAFRTTQSADARSCEGKLHSSGN